MSIELHVYAHQSPIARDEVARECLSPDLPEEFRWEVRFMGPRFLKESVPDVVRDGPVADGTVLGWQPDSAHATEIEAALQSGDSKALDALAELNAIGSADLFILTPADEEWEDVIESVKEDVEEAQHKKYLRGVQTFYSLETSATRNELSLEFQQALWGMIGALTYGLTYDPQEGEFDLLEEE